jgi:hypothetical protein
VLHDLAAAPDRDARMLILLHRKQEIIDNCKEITRHCNDPWIADNCWLIGKAIAAYEAGHYEAAMALAVNISDGLAIWASTPRTLLFKSEAAEEIWKKSRGNSKYKWAAFELSEPIANLSYDHGWYYKALIAPIPLFFKNWFPASGDDPPKSLSRHVVAHQPTRQHFSPENALLSLMLVTSLLYAMQEWSEVVRLTDDE